MLLTCTTSIEMNVFKIICSFDLFNRMGRMSHYSIMARPVNTSGFRSINTCHPSNLNNLIWSQFQLRVVLYVSFLAWAPLPVRMAFFLLIHNLLSFLFCVLATYRLFKSHVGSKIPTNAFLVWIEIESAMK